ncbi:MAG: redox-regulated ATPase YchF [Oscillospiraceae bacterium]|nr:redox-regulated ATPase YchF [Oscillospiraceae bacterium]
MKLGITGLPNVGKSTLFNALTNSRAQAGNYMSNSTGPNLGMVNVPDIRLEFLTKLSASDKTTPAFIEFVDTAGLMQGASKGEGAGNKFLTHIREVDAVIHTVRCFEDENVIHVNDSIDPVRDVEIVNMELILSDIELIERRVERVKKTLKGDKSVLKELKLLEDLLETLNDGKSARVLSCTPEEEQLLDESPLLSRKKIIYAANIGENDIKNIASNRHYNKLKELAESENAEIIPICAKIEAEINELDESEKSEFLSELGIEQPGLDKLIASSYKLLGLISFLTTGPRESRAWTIKKGINAQKAAGKIHSDLERGFIRAETVAYHDLFECGSMAAAKERGLVRSEGKDYIVCDGDVILFRFNV